MSDFTPSSKSDAIEELLTKVTGKSRVATIQMGGCMTCERKQLCRTCNQPAEAEPHTNPSYKHVFLPFRDPLSKREYEISGMCQQCQDEVFGREEQ